MELLVRVVSKTDTKDPVKDSQLTKAGDVIVYKRDGAEWGIKQLKNPEWRIIRVPGMTEEEAIALVSPELPPTLDKQYPLLKRRAMRLKLDDLDALAGGKIAADQATKVAEIEKLQLDRESGKVTDADVKAYIEANAVDAELAKADVMAIAELKPPPDEGK